MKIGKKSMSALVSTVLLICFAAMLGIVVMSWGASIIEETPSDECAKVMLSVSTENGAVSIIPKINNILCIDKKLDISELVK